MAKSIEEVEEEARQQARWEKERTRQERESQKNDDGGMRYHGYGARVLPLSSVSMESVSGARFARERATVILPSG